MDPVDQYSVKIEPCYKHLHLIPRYIPRDLITNRTRILFASYYYIIFHTNISDIGIRASLSKGRAHENPPGLSNHKTTTFVIF